MCKSGGVPGTWCTCEGCTSVVLTDGSMLLLQVQFANQVAAVCSRGWLLIAMVLTNVASAICEPGGADCCRGGRCALCNQVVHLPMCRLQQCAAMCNVQFANQVVHIAPGCSNVQQGVAVCKLQCVQIYLQWSGAHNENLICMTNCRAGDTPLVDR